MEWEASTTWGPEPTYVCPWHEQPPLRRLHLHAKHFSKTLNFQILQSQFAAQNLVIKELPFSITANKSCNSAYGLNAMFIPASNTTLSSTDTLLAKDNPTVGIRLLNEDRSVISIGKEFEFIPYTPTQTTVTKNFLAQLRWMTSRPILGPFNATAAIEVYYK